MRFTVIERARTWRRVDNHLDARHCPLCHATVHGNRGQHAHLDWHAQLAAKLDHLPDTAENGADEPWTAAVDQAPDDQQEATG